MPARVKTYAELSGFHTIVSIPTIRVKTRSIEDLVLWKDERLRFGLKRTTRRSFIGFFGPLAEKITSYDEESTPMGVLKSDCILAQKPWLHSSKSNMGSKDKRVERYRFQHGFPIRLHSFEGISMETGIWGSTVRLPSARACLPKDS